MSAAETGSGVNTPAVDGTNPNSASEPSPYPTDPLTSVDSIFTSYQEKVDADQAVRESIRETTKPLEKYSKQLQSQLQGIHRHQNPDLKNLCADTRSFLQTQIKPLWQELEAKVPEGAYFHYNDLWRPVSQRIVAAGALVYYLETEELASQEVIAEMMGLKVDPKEGTLYLDLEDYLQGLLQMASELSRFTVNCVINGDYSRPVRIGQFMSELNNGFRELNLKNDYLRKRYDSLKYDIKKVEEVIYDVSIRGLAPPVSVPAANEAVNANAVSEPPDTSNV